MRVGLYLDEQLEMLNGDLWSKLLRSGIDVVDNKKNIHQNPYLEGIDVVVFHPAYENKAGEWEATAACIDAHQQVQFYMFTVNAMERERYFGNRKNLVYVGNDSFDFFRDPAEYIAIRWNEFMQTEPDE